MGTGEELEKLFLHLLCRLEGLGPVTVQRIGAFAGGFRNAYYIEGMELKKAGILKREESCHRFDAWKKEFHSMEEAYYRLADQGIRFITPLDQEYPNRLLHMYDYPMGLYVKGMLPQEKHPAAAVIGARDCSAYGRLTAEHMAKELARAGVDIISGLALGIDGAGHKGALDGGGKTFAVLGCGVDLCYPRSNYSLYARIPDQGGLLSEYPPKTTPLPRNFPIRNRIISGLSDVILVMEARKKSGSLITAQAGLDQGKEIYALPGRITDALSEGCNQLIASGAFVLLSPSCVLENMGIFCEKREDLGEKNQKGLAKREKMVYSCLDSEPLHLEEIAKRAGLSVSQSMDVLLTLELGGYAVRTTGLYYVRGIL